MLLAINIVGKKIPNCYIFKDVKKIRDYIANCEPNECVGCKERVEWASFIS